MISEHSAAIGFPRAETNASGLNNSFLRRVENDIYTNLLLDICALSVSFKPIENDTRDSVKNTTSF